MKDSLPLPENKKLSVTYRVEPGCLGPEGKSHIEEFCTYAQTNLETLDSDYVRWKIQPRNDKALPETSYHIVGRSMNHDQAEKQGTVVGKSLDEFECHLGDKMADFIDVYLDH